MHPSPLVCIGQDPFAKRNADIAREAEKAKYPPKSNAYVTPKEKPKPEPDKPYKPVFPI
jgi:hypothetical protein